MGKTLEDMKIGDVIICYDEYKHDYEEHLLEIESIEYDDEGGIIGYGKDLTFPSDEFEEDYLSSVSEGNFVRFAN